MKIIPQSPDQGPSGDIVAQSLDRILNILDQSPHKPSGYKAYYREYYAKQLMPILDEIAKTGKPYFIPSSDLSISTIRQRLFQGFAYIKDHLDPEGRYRLLLDKFEIATVRNRGVVIRPKNIPGILDGYITEDWKPELLKYIDSARLNQKFERLGLNLTPGDIEWIHKQLEPVGHLFIYDVTRRHIKIIRYDNKD